jgi:hypothetical protein
MFKDSHFFMTIITILCLFQLVHSQPLTLDVEGLGSITVPSDVEPAVQVLRFARAASSKGGTSLRSRKAMDEILQYFCSKRECKQNLPETFELKAEYGVIDCEPWDEPATLVERYALAVLLKGVKLEKAVLTPILKKLCEATVCFTNTYRLPENPETLNIENIGKITVGAFKEPADIVEEFAQQVVNSGKKFGFDEMKKVMEYFCSKRTCNRLQLNPPVEAISLNIEGIGKMTVLSNQEPADVVEAFATQAVNAGFDIGFEQMKQMMEYFCARKKCVRLQINPPVKQPPLTLNIEGIGKMTVQPNQDPADVVEAFATQAVNGGFDIGFEQMKQMMEYFCARKKCVRLQINPPVKQPPIDLTVEGIGKMTVQPNQDPADVVESFAKQAVDAGFNVGFEQMKQMMEYFCARKKCVRLQINPPTQAAQAAPTIPAGIPGGLNF